MEIEPSTLDANARDTSKRNKNGGDADLYIKDGSSPIVDIRDGMPTGNYVCGSYSPDSNEQCFIPNSSTPGTPAAGKWFFAVYAWSTYPSVKFTATYTLDTGDPPLPTGDITATATEKGGRNKKSVQVRWEGATASTVDIHRTSISDGSMSTFVTTIDGSFKDNSGRAFDIYQVCETGSTSACSDPVTAN